MVACLAPKHVGDMLVYYTHGKYSNQEVNPLEGPSLRWFQRDMHSEYGHLHYRNTTTTIGTASAVFR